MSDPEDRFESEGGGLRRQLEEALAREKALKESLPAQLQEAEERGATRTQRSFEAKQIFGDLGYPKLADLWVQSNPEGSLEPDGAKEFLTTLGITPQQGGETPPPPPQPAVPPEVAQAAQAFTQPLTAQPGDQNYTNAEFKAALRDPNRREDALRAEREGRVEKRHGDIDPRLISIRDDARFFSEGG